MPSRRQNDPRVSRQARATVLQKPRPSSMSAGGTSRVRTPNHMTAAQSTSAGTNPPQLNAVTAGTAIVSLQIGGNDVDFANTILSCGSLSTTTGCLSAINDGLTLARTVLPGRLDQVYAAVRNRAPSARIVVVGYAKLLEPNGNCLNATKRTALNNAAVELNTIIKGRVQAAGANFVYLDAIDAFTGHGACGSSPWINSLSLLNGVGAAHPNLNGHQLGYLPLLNAITG